MEAYVPSRAQKRRVLNVAGGVFLAMRIRNVCALGGCRIEGWHQHRLYLALGIVVEPPLYETQVGGLLWASSAEVMASVRACSATVALLEYSSVTKARWLGVHTVMSCCWQTGAMLNHEFMQCWEAASGITAHYHRMFCCMDLDVIAASAQFTWL